MNNARVQVAVTSFVALFAIVGLALYGLPLYYDFMVRDFGWSRTQVTSGNAISKLLVGPLFGFAAGWIVDRFGPRRLMMAGIADGGRRAHRPRRACRALWMFYFFYLFNALGYVCGGPLPNQVLLSRWFDAARGKAMGFAYLGIGIGGALVPLLSRVRWSSAFGWRGALQLLGVLIVADRAAAGVLRARRAADDARPQRAVREPTPAEPASRRSASVSAASPRSTCSRSAACARSPRSAAPTST